MFQQSPKDIDAACIERVIKDAWQESDILEFKKTLPSKSGDDPWIKNGGKIGERAKREILAEIIAFSNAYGGWLIIGIGESATKPASAKELNPIPNCVELAERLSLQCRDCIEPQIQLIEIAGVPTETDGSGVVVIYVPKSRLAPHRSRLTKECYFRHADRSEPMTMREIQDLTLQVERGLAVIEKKFERKKTEFRVEAIRFDAQGANSFGVRATLIPLVKIGVEAVHNREGIRPPMNHLSVYVNNRGPHGAYLPNSATDWRPLIRGTIAKNEDVKHSTSRELKCDGLIEYRLFSRAEGDEPPILFINWMLGIFCNSLCAAEIFRRAAGSPNAEYGLEIELFVSHAPTRAGDYHGGHQQFAGAFQEGSLLFPRYSVGRRDEFQELTQRFVTDFWNGAGRWRPEQIGVDFETVFDQLGLN